MLCVGNQERRLLKSSANPVQAVFGTIQALLYQSALLHHAAEFGLLFTFCHLRSIPIADDVDSRNAGEAALESPLSAIRRLQGSLLPRCRFPGCVEYRQPAREGRILSLANSLFVCGAAAVPGIPPLGPGRESGPIFEFLYSRACAGKRRQVSVRYSARRFED